MYNSDDVNKMFEAIINNTALSPDIQERYGLPESPTLSDIQMHINQAVHSPGSPDDTVQAPGFPSGQHPSPYEPSTFQGTMPAPQMMSLDEMMDVINRRVELATVPRVQAAERSLQEQQLSGEKRKGELQEGYSQSLEDIRKQGQLSQQQGSQVMSRRGIYDSGLAADLSQRIGRSVQQFGFNLGEQQSRQLADLAEYLDLQTRHTNEEIQGIMGEGAMMAQTMLDDLRQEQQARGDMLSQREFENWLAMQAHELNQWKANLDEYWRETGYETGRSDEEYNRWFQQEQFRHQQEQAEWERVFNMNRWEAEHELQRMLANNQISQQEFQNALSLDEFALKKWLYEAQNTQQASHSYSAPAQQSGYSAAAPDPGNWWENLFQKR